MRWLIAIVALLVLMLLVWAFIRGAAILNDEVAGGLEVELPKVESLVNNVERY